MSEHFNIIGWLGKRPGASQKRATLEFVFHEFGEVMGPPSEMLLLDMEDQLQHLEPWDIDSSTLDRVLRPSELLVIYGRCDGGKGEQPSVSIDEAPGRASISISMPPHTLSRSAIGIDGMCRELCLELRKHSFKAVVFGGWEIDLPSDAKSPRELIERTSTETPAAEWLAISAQDLPPTPGFVYSTEKEGIAVLRRIKASVGH